VYVHIPFCERVCPYCDFAVVAAGRAGGELGPEREARYLGALLRELEWRRGAFAGRTLSSLYLGGGTPSLLRPESVARIAAAVREAFGAEGPVETTLELNPSTLERSRLPGFREAGVTRVSVGVQSFDDRVLHRLGRAHRAEEAHRTLRACREVGFDAVSLDLIFAAPGQSPADFEADLEQAVGFAPEHVSTYELTIEPGTPFALAAARGQLALPETAEARDAQAAAMIESAEARLGVAGLARYELSNYARPGHEAVHNRRYWQRRPVLGLGVGAFSTDPPGEAAGGREGKTSFGIRRSNLRDLGAYLERIEAGRLPEAGPAELLDARTARGEAVFLALREARGLDAARFADEFGRPPRGFFAGAIDELVAGGLLEERGEGDLRLTSRGRLLSNSVFERFV
jgi:oxygen-independent coproporphyrinogen-3 oxidase